MTGELLYHATDFEAMQSILRDGVLKTTDDELSFSVNCVMGYGDYCVRIRRRINLPKQTDYTDPKKPRWVLGSWNSKNTSVIKVTYNRNIPTYRLIFYKVLSYGEEGETQLKRIADPYAYFDVEDARPQVDNMINSLKLGLEVYDIEQKPNTIEQKPNTIDLLEGIPDPVQGIIKRMVGRGANPMGFTYYSAEDELYYFDKVIA